MQLPLSLLDQRLLASGALDEIGALGVVAERGDRPASDRMRVACGESMTVSPPWPACDLAMRLCRREEGSLPPTTLARASAVSVLEHVFAFEI